MQVSLRDLLANAHSSAPTGRAARARQTLDYAMIGAFGVPLLMLMIAAISGNVVQHRLVFSAEPLTPKLSKISPGAGEGCSASRPGPIC